MVSAWTGISVAKMMASEREKYLELETILNCRVVVKTPPSLPSPILLCAETEADCQTAALVAQAGYDPAFGARPLRRAIRDHIENPLAKALLAGRFTEGDTIRAAVKNGRLVFA